MILDGVTSQRWNNFQLFSLGEITGNYFTPVTSIIAMSFIPGLTLKLSASCKNVQILLIY